MGEDLNVSNYIVHISVEIFIYYFTDSPIYQFFKLVISWKCLNIIVHNLRIIFFRTLGVVKFDIERINRLFPSPKNESFSVKCPFEINLIIIMITSNFYDYRRINANNTSGNSGSSGSFIIYSRRSLYFPFYWRDGGRKEGIVPARLMKLNSQPSLYKRKNVYLLRF